MPGPRGFTHLNMLDHPQAYDALRTALSAAG
jgi:hypothetical protein